jgi:hypothetical protein
MIWGIRGSFMRTFAALHCSQMMMMMMMMKSSLGDKAKTSTMNFAHER